MEESMKITGDWDKDCEELKRLHQRTEDAKSEVALLEEQLKEKATQMMENPRRGAQQELTKILGVTRETLRQYKHRYYRTVIRTTADGQAFIKQPGDNVVASRPYEIRDKDGNVLVKGVPGSTLLTLRAEQLKAYRAERGGAGNISMVDVATLLPRPDTAMPAN